MWVDGLLPEGDARALIASRFEVSSIDAWMLLAHLGRDVAGALQIHTDDASSRGAHDAPNGDRAPWSSVHSPRAQATRASSAAPYVRGGGDL